MTTEKQVMFMTLFAVASRGGKLYWPKAPDISGYGQSTQDALVRDYEEACRVRAYIVERPFLDENRHGWRLNRLMQCTGQSDIGPMFRTRQAFYDAMRLVQEINRQ